MKPTLKQSLRGHLRRSYAPLYLRDANATLATSRGSGSSWGARLPVILGAYRARALDPKALIAYIPPIPKLAKIVAPGVYRRKPARPSLKPCLADVDVMLTATSGHRDYVRMTNGQIIKAHLGSMHSPTLSVSTPSQEITLRAEDQKQLAKQELPRG